MYTPLIIAAMTLAVSAHGIDGSAARVRTCCETSSMLWQRTTGLVGTGFHLYNVLKRPGRLTWQNLFYGAPLGAPWQLFFSRVYLAFILNVCEGATDRSRGCSDYRPVGHWPHSQVPACSVPSAEAGLLHFRGAYHNPFMFAPVTIPPITAALMVDDGGRQARGVTAGSRGGGCA